MEGFGLLLIVLFALDFFIILFSLLLLSALFKVKVKLNERIIIVLASLGIDIWLFTTDFIFNINLLLNISIFVVMLFGYVAVLALRK
jgi:hypothetical protein